MRPRIRLRGLAAAIRANVRAALREDVGSGDLTAQLVPAHAEAHAEVVTREPAILCGQPWFEEVFAQLEPRIRVSWLVAEGATIAPGERICALRGPARAMLTGERTALNFLQTLSGVATAVRGFAAAVEGTRCRVLDTRKTIPGLRLAQKYAVRLGGASNHRIGLFDAILIKENHIVSAGGITPAVKRARALDGRVLLEVEVETMAQLEEALIARVDRVLLDNFSHAGLREAVELRDRVAPDITLEASGTVTRKTIRQVAETGVDFVSVGSLTKHLRAIDLSMRFAFD